MARSSTRTAPDAQAPAPTQAATTHSNPPARSGETVTVVCKVPNGMCLRIFTMVDRNEASPSGGRAVKMAQQVLGEYTVHGPARRFGDIPDHAIIGGGGLTPGIPKDFFDKWMEQNADHPAVLNKMIFAAVSDDDARAEARARTGQKSGMHPLIPDTDPRFPKSRDRNLKGVSSHDDKDE